MNMLIRSQDKKELHNINRISMIRVVSLTDKHLVEVNSQHTIGVYSTEEKAIKVIDMIFEDYRNLQFVDATRFQMPQDSEV